MESIVTLLQVPTIDVFVEGLVDESVHDINNPKIESCAIAAIVSFSHSFL